MSSRRYATAARLFLAATVLWAWSCAQLVAGPLPMPSPATAWSSCPLEQQVAMAYLPETASSFCPPLAIKEDPVTEPDQPLEGIDDTGDLVGTTGDPAEVDPIPEPITISEHPDYVAPMPGATPCDDLEGGNR